jgi:hypothetical protein
VTQILSRTHQQEALATWPALARIQLTYNPAYYANEE